MLTWTYVLALVSALMHLVLMVESSFIPIPSKGVFRATGTSTLMTFCVVVDVTYYYHNDY